MGGLEEGRVPHLNSPASPPSSRWAAYHVRHVTYMHVVSYSWQRWDRAPAFPPRKNPQVTFSDSVPSLGEEVNTREMYHREKTLNVDGLHGLEMTYMCFLTPSIIKLGIFQLMQTLLAY